MRLTKRGAAILSVIAVFAITPGSVFAQSARTFVSAEGADTGVCSLTAPCRSFAYAVTQTASGGEVAVLSTAGYGPVTINHAISIINQDGVEAGITTTSAEDAVTVSAGASDIVNLRGLTLVGGETGNNGITLNSAGTLNIQNCVVRGFESDGINLVHTASSKINVSDTILSNNGNDGLGARPTGSGVASALSIERVQFLGSGGYGLDIDGTGVTSGSFKISISDSLASGGGAGGFSMDGSSAAPVTMAIVNSRVFNNVDYGVVVSNPGGTMYLSQVTTIGNGKGYAIFNSGTITFKVQNEP